MFNYYGWVRFNIFSFLFNSFNLNSSSYVCGGALLFSKYEGWDFLNGSYFCFISLSTIGFGDIVPGDKTYGAGADGGAINISFVLCSMYLMLGMALIAMCFNLMQVNKGLTIKISDWGEHYRRTIHVRKSNYRRKCSLKLPLPFLSTCVSIDYLFRYYFFNNTEKNTNILKDLSKTKTYLGFPLVI